MLKPDSWIIDKCIKENLITPFNTEAITEAVGGFPIISRGLSSYGYDAALAEDNFKIFVPLVDTEIDAKNFRDQCLFTTEKQKDVDGSAYYVLPPHSYALGMTVETFKIPPSIMAFSYPKRIYSRAGIMVNIALLNPEWEGRLIIQIGNLAPLPNRLYINEGITQIVFCEASEVCRTTYKQRAGSLISFEPES